MDKRKLPLWLTIPTLPGYEITSRGRFIVRGGFLGKVRELDPDVPAYLRPEGRGPTRRAPRVLRDQAIDAHLERVG